MSRIIVDAVRNSSASSDGITLASDGSVTIPGNATCSGTATGFGGGKLLQVQQMNERQQRLLKLVIMLKVFWKPVRRLLLQLVMVDLRMKL